MENNSNLTKIVSRFIVIASVLVLFMFSLVSPLGLPHIYAFTVTAIDPAGTPTATDTSTPTDTPTPANTPTPTPTPTFTPTPTPTPTFTPTPTPTPTSTPTPTPTPTHTPRPTPTKNPIPTPTRTLRPTPVPTATPRATQQPVVAPTAAPTPTAILAPSQNSNMLPANQSKIEHFSPIIPVAIGMLAILIIALSIGGLYLRQHLSLAPSGELFLQDTGAWDREESESGQVTAITDSFWPSDGNLASTNQLQEPLIKQEPPVWVEAAPVSESNQLANQPASLTGDMPALDDPHLVDYLRQYVYKRLIVPFEQRQKEQN